MRSQPPGVTSRVAEINQRYKLDMDFESVPRLCERFALTFPKLTLLQAETTERRTSLLKCSSVPART